MEEQRTRIDQKLGMSIFTIGPDLKKVPANPLIVVLDFDQ